MQAPQCTGMALAPSDETWHASEDGSIHWVSQTMNVPQGQERWVSASTSASQQRSLASVHRHVTRAQTEWEKKCWHIDAHRFACHADAQEAVEREQRQTCLACSCTPSG